MRRPSYNVVIKPADNGIVVRVGCKLLVFPKAEQDNFLCFLRDYLDGKEEELRQYFFPEDYGELQAPPVDSYAPGAQTMLTTPDGAEDDISI